jgi:hypothetical protein
MFNSFKCSNVQCVQMFKTQKFNVSQKPNFYTELDCEVSGDAARLDTPPASALQPQLTGDGLI